MSSLLFEGSTLTASDPPFSSVAWFIDAKSGVLQAGIGRGGRMYAKGHRVNGAGIENAIKRAYGAIMYRRRYDRRRKYDKYPVTTGVIR